ncbi:MAG: aminopeptidase [Candidatus Woesearchaeota archaeon]
MDPRITKIAEILVNYSTKVKEGEYVQLGGDPVCEPLLKELYRLVLKKGAYPVMKLGFPWQSYVYYKNASEKQLEHFPEVAMEEMKKTDAVIYVSGGGNTRQLTNIDPKLLSLRQKVVDPVSKERQKKKWVIFYFPSDSFAQEAEMSTEEFEDFVYGSCLFDWEEKSKELDRFVEIMKDGKEVRVVGEDTDLSFSIEGRKFVKGDGIFNMPDGEIFTAPVEKTVNGHIKFSYPAIYGGREVGGVYFEFKDGEIVKASAEKNEEFLKEMIGTDEGSKFLGEFGIGLNPGIKKPIKNILFDEKQDKTIHLAIGNAYPECGGTNKSAIHWDIVKDMRNGGKIFLDGKLVYENGEFL